MSDETIDWENVAKCIAIKYGAAEGTLVVGDWTQKFVREKAQFVVSRDSSSITMSWVSPPLEGRAK